MRTIDDLGDLKGKKVLLRSDLNVPLDDDGTITDDGRIRASVPTIQLLSKRGARVIVCAHLGRPEGKPDDKYSLKPVAARLSELLEAPVEFATDTVGESAQGVADGLKDGEVALLENLRFNPGETAKKPEDRAEFTDQLASLADVFVSDGFGVVHREQASVFDIAERLPQAAGGLILTEVDVLKRLAKPQRPYAVVLGGAKVSDKLGVIENLLKVADVLLIGGGMVFTFLKAQGYEVGTSLLEADQVATVKRYLAEAENHGVDIVLPVDIVAATKFSADAEHDVVAVDKIPADRMGLDIGPESAKLFADKISGAKTIFWNGPVGAFEMEPYAAGTKVVAQALVDVTKKSGAVTVVGGGDSAAAVRDLGFADSDFTHISTGGGASLEFLEGKTLPGLAVLED